MLGARNRAVLLITVGLILSLISVMGWASGGGITTRASIASDGSEGNSNSHYPDFSGDGRYVAFESRASNLVAGDTNGVADIFVHDRLTGEAIRVSVASDGSEGNAGSSWPRLSSDGRYIAFHSSASNLVEGDTNGQADTFVHDRLTGETTRVSVASDGSEGSGSYDLHDISGDGRYVAFPSSASDLVAGDANGVRDIFVHDRLTGETTRVSVASDGSEANGTSVHAPITSDGRYIAFQSGASNLVAGDTNGVADIFVHDRLTGETTRVSVASDGSEGDLGSYDPRISSDGRYVAFDSWASNLVDDDINGAGDVFVHDRLTGETTRVGATSDGSERPAGSYAPAISSDGRYVAFQSDAPNLVAGDTNGVADIFVHDRLTGETIRVSVASDGSEGNDSSSSWFAPTISSDGRYVAFESRASNLVAGDTNGTTDIFVHDRGPANQPPTVQVPAADIEVNEGSPAATSGSFLDPDDDTLTLSCDCSTGFTDNGDGTWAWSLLTIDGPAESQIVTIYADDGKGGVGQDTFELVVHNVAPIVGTITGPVDPVQVGIEINISADFADPGVLDTHTTLWDWGDSSSSPGTVNEIGGSGFASASHTYTTPGVYTVVLAITDKDGGVGESVFQYVVVYDPEGGFVTGGGWIDSLEGSYAPDPSLTGKANFGFVSKYKKGSDVPTGQTEFKFKAGDLNFHSADYDWLVIAGARAQFKGIGTINGIGEYGFMLIAIDAELTPSTDVDKFRIKIWDRATDEVVYDNQMGDAEDADSATEIGGGNIVIHKR
ncbi:MAG: PD40 domain-containing protein [Anaerolineae bacterium]|nr:PD40 domain-containing protein [Anaerolineae bacterium]